MLHSKNDGPEASQHLEKQEPGYVPELMTPISLPSGLDGSFCADKTGFCGSKGIEYKRLHKILLVNKFR
jgi:hypothetical protein